MYPQYREAGIMFWRGFTIQDYLHTMFGDAHDLNLGRQMPNHFGARHLNVVTVSSPIGTRGLGKAVVYGRRRTPRPPAKITACIGSQSAERLVICRVDQRKSM